MCSHTSACCRWLHMWHHLSLMVVACSRCSRAQPCPVHPSSEDGSWRYGTRVFSQQCRCYCSITFILFFCLLLTCCVAGWALLCERFRSCAVLPASALISPLQLQVFHAELVPWAFLQHGCTNVLLLVQGREQYGAGRQSYKQFWIILALCFGLFFFRAYVEWLP